MPAAPRAITYIDTSVWCAYCFNEPEAPEAVRWLAEAELDRTATALWAHTEFASACGIKLRAKGQTSQAVARARQAFDSAVSMAHRLEASPDDFLYAAELCIDSPVKLRGGDALHLAIALRHHCKAMASLDKDMAKAAQHLGLQVIAF